MLGRPTRIDLDVDPRMADDEVTTRVEALDRRVDPSGDAAHAALAFADHAEATGQWALRLRPELSTARPLEAR
ncbi:MAG TPA: hypothetical protein VF158_13220, partial [Longimicrobiales bacterium]